MSDASRPGRPALAHLTRYTPLVSLTRTAVLVQHPNGEWVKYDDVLAALPGLGGPQEPANADAIKKSLDTYAQYLGYHDAAAMLGRSGPAPQEPAHD